MLNIYPNKIDIVVQSKYPQILKEFRESFLPTVTNFPNLTLHVFDGHEYGAKPLNDLLGVLVHTSEYFGVFNDDMWFVQGWLENVVELLKDHEVVSAGYVETKDKNVFLKAVETTKKETGFVPYLYGPNAMFRVNIFKKIGRFDDRYDWSCDDLDWAWRIHLNKMSSVTSKKITVGHMVGTSLTGNSKNWHGILKLNNQRFYDKHGYDPYRWIRSEYKTYHQYFRQFK